MIRIKVDERIFPLQVVQMACYALLDRVETRIVRGENEELIVELERKRKDNGSNDLEALFNEELIAASVSLDSLEKNSNLRDYFARTAFIPTTYNKKAIEEFVEKAKDSRDAVEDKTEKVDKTEEEVIGFKFDEGKGKVCIELPKRRYLVSDVLHSLREVYRNAYGKIAGVSGDKIVVELEVKDKASISLQELKDGFVKELNSHD